MTQAEARDLAFRLFLRNVEPAKIAEALQREHSYKATPTQLRRWVDERLKRTGQDPQSAKIASAIAEATRELWAAASAPGIRATEKAAYLQAIARNEERLVRVAGVRSDAPAVARYANEPREGRCGARGRGIHAGRFCDEDPVEGRRRCRIHGGATPREAARHAVRHGAYRRAVEAPELFRAPPTVDERRLMARWEREPEEMFRHFNALDGIFAMRALHQGALDIYARVRASMNSGGRTLVSLREVPPPERGVPKVVELFEGKTREDFERDLEVIRRDAAVPSGVSA